MFKRLLTITLLLVGVCQVFALPKHCKPKLVNGNFETGSLAPWVDSTSGLGSTNTIGKGYKSKYALSLTPAPTGSDDATYAGEEQELNLCANVTYTLSWAFRYTAEGTNAGFFAYYRADGTLNNIYSSFAYTMQQGKWYNVSMSYSAPTSQTAVGFICQSGNTSATYLVDNVKLTVAS